MRNCLFQNRTNLKSLFSMLFLLISVTVCTGQNSVEKFQDQPTVVAEALMQTDSPIFISIVNVDNSSSLSFQKVNFNVQNISNKPIKAFVITGCGILTTFFPLNLFESGRAINNECYEEKANIKHNTILTLTVDYVEFKDGTNWGKDTQGHSEMISGQRNGQTVAIEKLRELLNNKDFDTLKNLLEQERTEINVAIPDSKQADKWQSGFRLGHRSVISAMRRTKERDLNSLSEKLDKLEKAN